MPNTELVKIKNAKFNVIHFKKHSNKYREIIKNRLNYTKHFIEYCEIKLEECENAISNCEKLINSNEAI